MLYFIQPYQFSLRLFYFLVVLNHDFLQILTFFPLLFLQNKGYQSEPTAYVFLGTHICTD